MTVNPVAAAHLVVPFARHRPGWARQHRTLSRIDTMAGFEHWVRANQPDPFTAYRDDRADAVADQFAKTAAALGLELAGRRVLDVGPGLGEALDAAREAGAGAVDFVELDPVFFCWNRLRGATGHRFNHALGLGRLGARRFDVVWARGAHIADWFAACPWLLGRWLRSAASVTAPGGRVVVVPFWCHTDVERTLDVRCNRFTATMLAAGFDMVEAPSDLIGGTAYPVVFDRHP